MTEGSHYRFVAVYSYQVNGIAYPGNTVQFGGTDVGTRVEAEGLAARFPVGSTTVFFNPKRPQQSALLPSATGPGRYWLFWGALFVIWGLLIALGVVKISE